MLRLVLDRSAEAAVPPESMFLVDTAAARRSGELGDAAEAARLLERIWEHPRVRGWGLPAEPPPVPAGLSHAEAYRFVVEAPFRAYASLAGKSRWGDKTPAYLHHVDELLADLAGRPIHRARAGRARCRALDHGSAFRPEQRLGRRAKLGSGDQARPGGRAAPSGSGADAPLRGPGERAQAGGRAGL